MLTPKRGVLKDMYRQLNKYRALFTLPLEDWVYQKGRFDNGVYTMESESVPFKRGERWFAGYDEAHFFTTTVTVPILIQTTQGRALPRSWRRA